MSSRVRIYLKSANNPGRIFTTPMSALAELMVMYQKPSLGQGLEWTNLGGLKGRAIQGKKIHMGFNGPEALYQVQALDAVPVHLRPEPPMGPIWKRAIWLYQNLLPPWKGPTILVVTREGRSENFGLSPAHPTRFGHYKRKGKLKANSVFAETGWPAAAQVWGIGHMDADEGPLLNDNSLPTPAGLSYAIPGYQQAHAVAAGEIQAQPPSAGAGGTPKVQKKKVFSPSGRARVGIWR